MGDKINKSLIVGVALADYVLMFGAYDAYDKSNFVAYGNIMSLFIIGFLITCLMPVVSITPRTVFKYLKDEADQGTCIIVYGTVIVLICFLYATKNMAWQYITETAWPFFRDTTIQLGWPALIVFCAAAVIYVAFHFYNKENR